MPKFKDLSGQKFNRLTAIEPLGRNDNREIVWLCECDCGNMTETSSTSLRIGRSKSCGCLQREIASDTGRKNFTKHGMSKTRLWNIWSSMKARCSNPNIKEFKYYGAKGIDVCEEWLDYNNFYEWAMMNGYADSLTIDRKNIEGNYEPSNCRWVTMKEQDNNKSNNIIITIDGVDKTLSEWCDFYNTNYKKAYYRYRTGNYHGIDLFK